MRKLMIGTWKSLDKISETEFREFIINCIGENCLDFDTAMVYSNGKVEEILGEFSELKITTKIPAKIKPCIDQFADFEESYNNEWINNCLFSIKSRLGKWPDTLLLHNWNKNWNGSEESFKKFIDCKKKYKYKVGISIPNDFFGIINDEIIRNIDFVMAPYNKENNWIKNNWKHIKNNNVEIIVRSIFLGGKEIPKDSKELKNTLDKTFFADKILVGTCNIDHVKEILSCIKL